MTNWYDEDNDARSPLEADLSPMYEPDVVVSYCCSAKPLGEPYEAQDGTFHGRCSSCLENTTFERETE